MKPRERVLRTLNREAVDRPPCDVYVNYVVKELEEQLKKHFNLQDWQAVLVELGADLRWMRAAYTGPDLSLPENQDILAGLGSEDVVVGYADETSARLLQNAESVADIERFRFPNPDWFDYSIIPLMCHQYQDYALVANQGWNPTFCRIAGLAGIETSLTWLITKPALIEAAVEHIEYYNYEYARRILEAAQGRIDILYTGDDFATQRGPMFNPDLWRRYFKKPLARLCELARSHGARVMYHSCGAIRAYIPDFIEIGIDIVMPVQVRAEGMSPDSVKRDFGDRLSFYGAVDTQDLLPFASPDRVRQEVRHLLDVMGKGGGYILSSSHALLKDVPLQNVLAMYDEARSYCSPGGSALL